MKTKRKYLTLYTTFQTSFMVLLFLGGCAAISKHEMPGFMYTPINTEVFEIATWMKINNPNDNHIHIYIEGDGYAYNAYGQPTDDPTPRGMFVRNLAVSDKFDNVVYMARPCQFIMDKNCTQSDWTSGRFSQNIITAESEAIKQIAKDKQITLIGYSGGAMVSGLVINQNPQMNIEKWITIAGILNPNQWTQYFGDAPLTKSLDLHQLPTVAQTHYFGGRDKVVPYKLAKQWVADPDIILIPNATHDDFGKLKLF